MVAVTVRSTPEALLDVIVAGLADPSADPFQPEWVSVPTLGFRSWLQLRLAERLGASRPGDGIVANVDMPFPATLRWNVLASHARAGGHTEQTDPWQTDPWQTDPWQTDPWQTDRLVWAVLAVLADEGSPIDPRLRRSALPVGVSLASRAWPIADLFDQYDVRRPDMVRAWTRGRDVGADGTTPLDEDHRWQPQLYRAVRDAVIARHGVRSPSERLTEALRGVADGSLDLVDAAGRPLPERLFLFGASTLSAELGPILDAVGQRREVHLLLLSPSPATTGQIAAATRDGREPAEPDHPLLASWGRRSLDSGVLLATAGLEVDGTRDEASAGPTSLLERVQDDLRAGRVPGSAGRTPLDGSVQVHAAPGFTRQVEVLRDVILGLLRDVPDLTESDIAILCPRLDDLSSTITAVLGPTAQRNEQPSDGAVPPLRYTVVDRAARTTNPVMASMAALLEMAPGRFDTSVVRDLLSGPAVVERMGLTSEDFELLARVIDDTGIRWGLDSAHRAGWGIDAGVHANTWSSGLDQLMMGIALGYDIGEPRSGAADRYALAVGGIAPAPIDDGAIAGAGRLCAALRTIDHVRSLLVGSGGEPAAPSASRPIAAWRDVLLRCADLVVAPARFEDWQRSRFDEALDALVAAAADDEGTPSDVPLTLADVRRLLRPAFDGARVRADLGFGSIVVARPSLLAGVPFRVVCVLGLDEGAMPVGVTSGDDLTAAAPKVGDRDARAEARADLLSAIGGARERLVVTCTSRDIRTNDPVPRSVVLDELLDVVAATIEPAEQAEPADATGASSEPTLVHEHPRQAFDPRSFRAVDGAPPFSFDPISLGGAEAVGRRDASPGASSSVLIPEPGRSRIAVDEPIDLARLRRFFEHPVKAYFRDSLQIVLPSRGEPGEDQLPVEITRLEQSVIGSELLGIGIAAGEQGSLDPTEGDHDPVVAAYLGLLRASGALPPESIATAVVDETVTEAQRLLDLAQTCGVRGAYDDTHTVAVTLDGGRVLQGTVTRCAAGTRPGPVSVRYSRDKPKYRLAVAIDLLVLTAQYPGTPWRGVHVGRGTKTAKPPVSIVWRVRGADAAERRTNAVEALSVLVRQYLDGMTCALPLFQATSYALHTGGSTSDAWGDPTSDPTFAFGKEAFDPYHQRAFGTLAYDELTTVKVGTFTLASEADRLWATLDGALVEDDGSEDDGSEDDGSGADASHAAGVVR